MLQGFTTGVVNGTQVTVVTVIDSTTVVSVCGSSTTEGTVDLSGASGSGGTFSCSCSTTCGFSGSGSYSISTYENTGPSSTFTSTILQITTSFTNSYSGAVYNFDGSSGLELQSGSSSAFSVSSTFSGSGYFRALAGAVISFASASTTIFQIASTIAGTFTLASSSITQFSNTVEVSGSSSRVTVGSGCRYTCSSFTSVLSSAVFEATSGTAEFSGGLALVCIRLSYPCPLPIPSVYCNADVYA